MMRGYRPCPTHVPVMLGVAHAAQQPGACALRRYRCDRTRRPGGTYFRPAEMSRNAGEAAM